MGYKTVSRQDDFQSHTVFILGHGLYQLAFRSKLLLARRFQKWVIEVLPSIWKTGTYTLPPALKTIRRIKDAELLALCEDDRKEANKTFQQKLKLTKDPDKVTLGRLGGLATQQKYREIISKS